MYNDGDHHRISNVVSSRPWEELRSRRLAAIEKHRELLGSYWYRYRCADESLAYIRSRRNPLKTILGAGKEYGLMIVTRVLADRLFRKLSGG